MDTHDLSRRVSRLSSENSRLKAEIQRLQGTLSSHNMLISKLNEQMSQRNDQIMNLGREILILQSRQERIRTVTTESKFVSLMLQDHLLAWDESFEINVLWPIQNEYGDYWSASLPSTFPILGTAEKNGTQKFVVDMLFKLQNNVVLTSPHTTVSKEVNLSSTLDENAYQRISYASRKPDFVAYEPNRSGPFAITLIGEVKGRTGESQFSNQEIGHVIDMGIDLMKTQLRRKNLVMFLTDGFRMQFFLLRSNGLSPYSCGYSKIYKGKTGWLILFGLLQESLQNLGYAPTVIDGVKLISVLGQGGQCVAYSGIFEEKACVIKVYQNSSFHSTEVSMLQRLHLQLAESDHLRCSVPQLLHGGLRCGDQYVTVTESVHDSVQSSDLRGRIVSGSHIVQLVRLLQRVHEIGNCHRDIKPDNIYVSSQNQIVLSDWASASTINQLVSFQGTPGFNDFEGLAPEFHEPTAADDLKALVKSAYLMIFNQPAPTITDSIGSFWNQRLTGNWDLCYGSIQKCSVKSQESKLNMKASYLSQQEIIP